MSPTPATGIVLAGGRSTRFGGDKLAVEIEGRRVLHRAIDAVALAVAEIVVVIGSDGPEPALPADAGVPVAIARDAVAGQGPLAGLVAGLAAARHPVAVLVGGDQPSLRPAVLRDLLDELGAQIGEMAFDVVALEDGGRLRPLPAAVRVSTVWPAGEAALAAGTHSLLGLFERLAVRRVDERRWRMLDPDGASLRDVDTRDDLPAS